MSSKDVHLCEVLIEFTRVGNSVRVAAIDPITGTEVITVGSPRYHRKTLMRQAKQKLVYVLKKNGGRC